MITPRTLLIDADVPLYRAAFAAEVETDWGDDLWTLHSNMDTAKEVFNQEIGAIRDAFPTNAAALLCFSGTSNFRKQLLPTYKSNRKKVRKPMLLSKLRAWAMETYDSDVEHILEADDLLGLLSKQGIMVSIDKDLKTVPGLHYNPDYPDEGTYHVTTEDAHYTHMMQTLCGDATDGYSGCPGAGPVAAGKILACPMEAMWGNVVKAFAKKGISQADALIQAQVSRILRGDEFDFGTSTLKLWKPHAEI